jgi:hypothetical protein
VRTQEKALAGRQQQWEKEQQAKPAPAEPRDAAFSCPLNGTLHFQGPEGKGGTAVYRGKSPVSWSDGPLGQALRLDGQADSFLDVGQAVSLERGSPLSYGAWVQSNGSGAVLSKMDDGAAYRGFDLLLDNGKVTVHLVHRWPDNAVKVTSREALPKDAWAHVFVTYDGSGKAGGVKLYLNGRVVPLDVQSDNLRDTIATAQPLRVGKRSASLPFKGVLADVRIYRRALPAAEVQALATQPLAQILKSAPGQRSKVQQGLLAQGFRDHFAADLRAAQDKLAQVRKDKAEVEKRIPTVMVMEELKTPRETFVLKRGRYDMPDKSQKVEPGVPACLSGWPADASRNRLGLALWLVSADNPLTARVRVNHYWQHYFGTGLVKTAENFGVQGELPSHPELLDWLATEFVRSNWDVKAMQRLIVTSASYRQTSKATDTLLARDAENRLLARGPRFRLPAEVVRDNALAVSGLLVEMVGGPTV